MSDRPDERAGRPAPKPLFKYTQAQMDAAIQRTTREVELRERNLATLSVAKARSEGEAFGRQREAAIRDDGLSQAAKEVRGLLELQGRRAAAHTKRDLAAFLYNTYAASDSVWKRLSMALGGRWR